MSSFGSHAIGAPTKAEAKRERVLREDVGCICCRLRLGVLEAPEIHHLTVGGKHGAPQLGHRFTIPLCPWHHRGHVNPGESAADALGIRGPSYAKQPRLFREQFGADQELLDATDIAAGWPLIRLDTRSKIVPRAAA